MTHHFYDKNDLVFNITAFKNIKMSVLVKNALVSLVMYLENFDDPEMVNNTVDEIHEGLHEELTSFFDFIKTYSNEPKFRNGNQLTYFLAEK